jgi:hypothetical protein
LNMQEFVPNLEFVTKKISPHIRNAPMSSYYLLLGVIILVILYVYSRDNSAASNFRVYSPEHWTRAHESLGRFDEELRSSKPIIHNLSVHADAFEANMYQLKMRVPNDLYVDRSIEQYIRTERARCEDSMQRIRRELKTPFAFPRTFGDYFGDNIVGVSYVE